MAYGQLVRITGAMAAAVVVAALGAMPAVAQEDPGSTSEPITTDAPHPEQAPPTIGDALTGKLDGVAGFANGGFGGDETMEVTLTFDNSTELPVTLVVPRGALFESEDPSEQTIVTSGPLDESPKAALASDADPTVTIEPGIQTLELQGFCAQEFDYGPVDIVPLDWAGVAEQPLPTVARNIAQQQVDLELSQQAVWWVTDNPVSPPPEELEPLLEGVDIVAFAETPVQVVPDTDYQPLWKEEQAYDGGSGASSGRWGSLLGLLIPMLVIAGIAGVAIAATSSSRRRAATVRTGMQPPGWHPDPYDPRRSRYWDGTRWTDQTR